MSCDTGGDEVEGCDRDDSQKDDDATVHMAHCRREGFVGLVESGSVIKIVERRVAGEVMCEEMAAVVKSKRIDTSVHTRGACAREAHATVAPMTTKRTSEPANSKDAEQIRSSGLTAFQTVMALERKRSRPVTRATSKRFGWPKRGVGDALVPDRIPGSVNGDNELSFVEAGALTDAYAFNASQLSTVGSASESALRRRLRQAHVIRKAGGVFMNAVELSALTPEGDKSGVPVPMR